MGQPTPKARTLACWAALGMLALAAGLPFPRPALAQGAAPQPLSIPIGFIGLAEEPSSSLSFLDPIIRDGGLQGARVGVADNDTTGKFLKQDFTLVEAVAEEPGKLAESAQGLLAQGVRIIVADLPAKELLALTDLPAAKGTLVINARARDDALRNQDCRPNLLHTVPSRRMLADALGQYLLLKRWTRWFLVEGPGPGDRAFADAIRRTAKRLNARIVEDKPWTFDVGNARTDDGFTNDRDVVQTFTQGADYDVLVVADEGDRFGDYLSHRTARPRPVAGTHELVPTAWSRVFEMWGGTQLQNRFQAAAGRVMTERDYAAWAAVRAVGEAASRVKSADPEELARFIQGPAFALAGFKGQSLSFRPWDGQLRQPILVANPRLLVSVSPQEGFLHQRTPLDSLGDDLGESGCKARGP